MADQKISELVQINIGDLADEDEFVIADASASDNKSITWGVMKEEIAESGSNTNGEYVRFADGTQICTRTFDLGDVTANGTGTLSSPYHTEPATVSFAATFIAEPAVSFSFPTSGGGVPARILVPAGYGVSTTAIEFLRVARASDDDTASIVEGNLTATGRWF